MAQNKVGVIYKWYKTQKFNGSLYYAFEHYVQLLNVDANAYFYIIGISDKDLELVKKAFRDKYDNIDKYFTRMIGLRVTSIIKQDLIKVLIMDLRTYNAIRPFIVACDTHVYSNDGHDMIRPSTGTVTYYGEYDYQNYDIREKLKINFSIFKKISINDNDATFISSRFPKQVDNVSLSKKYNLKNILKKSDDDIIDNLFERIDSILYVHQTLDTNNRILVEAKFYHKTIIIDEQCDIIDSTVLRYKDLQEGHLNKYTLNKESVIIKNMLP